MKKITTLFLLLVASTYSSAQTWTQKNNFIESYQDNGIAVNNEGYALISYDIGGAFNSRIYKYNQANDSWSVVSVLPLVPRQGAALFSIGTKIYVAGGLPMVQPPNNYLRNTMFEYDLVTDTWVQKSNIGFINEFYFTSYSTYSQSYNGKGYIFVSAGANRIVEYNPITDTYVEKTACPSTTITSSKKFSFISGDKIYVGLGPYNSSNDELWEYNITTDNWTQKANAPQGYSDCLSFVINDDFYIGTGLVAGSNNYIFYKYNIPNNTWTQITDPVQFIKIGGFAFTINNKAYACGGLTVSEVWEYSPSNLGNNEYSTKQKTKLYPNPIKNNGILNIASEKVCSSYKIYSMNGSVITEGSAENNCIKFSNILNGEYLITLIFDDKSQITQAIVIE